MKMPTILSIVCIRYPEGWLHIWNGLVVYTFLFCLYAGNLFPLGMLHPRSLSSEHKDRVGYCCFIWQSSRLFQLVWVSSKQARSDSALCLVLSSNSYFQCVLVMHKSCVSIFWIASSELCSVFCVLTLSSCRRCYEISCENTFIRDGYGNTYNRVGACRDSQKSVVVQVIMAPDFS